MFSIQPQPAGLPSGSFGGRRRAAAGAFRFQRLLAAPHRLAFMAGSALMVATALWWALALVARHTGVALPWQVNPASAHALLMAQGFMPLFIVGFAFTAGPRWLGLGEVSARQLTLPVALMLGGWLVALTGFHGAALLSSLGVAIAAVGFALATGLFALLVLESAPRPGPRPALAAGAALRGPEGRGASRHHAQLVLAGCAIATVAQWAAAVMLALEFDQGVRAAVMAGLWGGLGLVFATVLHRMVPFFTQSALPEVPAWRPTPLLGILALAMVIQAPLAAIEVLGGGTMPPALAGLRAALELPLGAMLLWLSVRWGLRQSLQLRLLAMLHLGFAWLGVAFTLAGVSHALMSVSGGAWSLGLAPTHAFTMGFLGSTLLAMATRVARGHSGRPLVADHWTWLLFWALQVAVLARVLAALWPAAGVPFTLLAAQFWLAAVGAWGIRHMRWFGQPRRDGGMG